MKLVKCIVRAEKIDDLVKAVQGLVAGMTVSEVRGHGRQKGYVLVYRGVMSEVSLLPRLMLETVIDDNKVEDLVRLVAQSARTGAIGDGRIYVQAVEDAFHIRTGFMDLD
jgi:nitrogen regulatory protein PII